MAGTEEAKPATAATNGVNGVNGIKALKQAIANGITNGVSNGINGGANGTHEPPAYKAHPIGPLSNNEITQASALIKGEWPENTLFLFKVITLSEPAKAQLIPYLDAERKGQAHPEIDRRAFVVYYIKNTVSYQRALSKPLAGISLHTNQHKLHEAVVNLTQQKVESNVRLGPFLHANGDGDEIIAVEAALLANAKVQAEIAKLKLPEGSVVISDPWIYGM
jgi:primary-amine oxidase